MADVGTGTRESGSSSGTTAQPKTPAPKPVVGPYTGSVGTTDVSILYPMPNVGESVAFLSPTMVGDHGQLLSAADFKTVAGTHLDSTMSDPPSGYANLRLVSLRLDPCAPRENNTCVSEVRAVYQAIYTKAPGPTGTPVDQIGATDGALHVMYEVPETELQLMLQEILTLKKANGDLALHELAPHPILAQQGLAGAFAEGMRGIVLSHIGETRITRITHFDHNFDPDSDGWTFGIFDKAAGGTLVAQRVPTTTHTGQTVAGTSADAPLAQSGAFTFLETATKDPVSPLVDSGRGPANSKLQGAFNAALRVQNPLIHSAITTDCANCHLAEGAVRIGEAQYGFGPGPAFTHPRSLARVDQRTSVTNLHAFGYLGRQVSIMQRTANESVLVAAALEAKIK
jgi:hypothetical protein